MKSAHHITIFKIAADVFFRLGMGWGPMGGGGDFYDNF
jgi:hypothetical protein